MPTGLAATFSNWTIQLQHIGTPQIAKTSMSLIDYLLMTLMNEAIGITLP
jgi:hypothetical protein